MSPMTTYYMPKGKKDEITDRMQSFHCPISERSVPHLTMAYVF
jgi:hypothetical protein